MAPGAATYEAGVDADTDAAVPGITAPVAAGITPAVGATGAGSGVIILAAATRVADDAGTAVAFGTV